MQGNLARPRPSGFHGGLLSSDHCMRILCNTSAALSLPKTCTQHFQRQSSAISSIRQQAPLLRGWDHQYKLPHLDARISEDPLPLPRNALRACARVSLQILQDAFRCERCRFAPLDAVAVKNACATQGHLLGKGAERPQGIRSIQVQSLTGASSDRILVFWVQPSQETNGAHVWSCTSVTRCGILNDRLSRAIPANAVPWSPLKASVETAASWHSPLPEASIH